MIYCLEFLQKNIEWLRIRIEELPSDAYLLFDMPGQIELNVHHEFSRKLVQQLYHRWDYRLVCVHMIDSYHLANTGNFISCLLMSLSAMLHLELPHVNLLTKMDMLPQFRDQMAMDIEYYTEVQDLTQLLNWMPKDEFNQKFRGLNEALASTITDYSLVSFQCLDIREKESMLSVIKLLDKANGFAI